MGLTELIMHMVVALQATVRQVLMAPTGLSLLMILMVDMLGMVHNLMPLQHLLQQPMAMQGVTMDQQPQLLLLQPMVMQVINQLQLPLIHLLLVDNHL